MLDRGIKPVPAYDINDDFEMDVYVDGEIVATFPLHYFWNMMLAMNAALKHYHEMENKEDG